MDDPPIRPNLAGGDDVSLQVTTMSVPSEFVSFDRDWTSAIGTGARTAGFDDLFRDHYDRLVRSMTVACGDREQAADAVQEAFVKAHVRWRRIGNYEDPIGWVRRVAVNQLRDEHRRTGRKRRALARLASRTPTSDHPVEPDEFDRLLAELPRQQRLATALYYVDGMSVAEIAAALGIAEGSVKSHLFDARKRLRTVLDRERGTDQGR
ncbi:MAG TPA: sigma-70 family RNA polymerase sigma factor [Ilumatobacteraceae bacterium]|nr:sigma-70 family RNA polymerase sigma factor [Ilumatobacteraceae bacterium]